VLITLSVRHLIELSLKQTAIERATGEDRRQGTGTELRIQEFQNANSVFRLSNIFQSSKSSFIQDSTHSKQARSADPSD
jgi:hypothetical protein